ncbi:MAG TPA: putative quinol monooxygenase [Pirellulales bacterium]|nr:putative quinol monooxygenase [Pirellulales bacterium]
MYYLNVILTVKDAGRVESIRELLAQQGRLSRDEPGCLRFEVYQSQNEHRRFVLVETWETKAAWEVHRQGKAVSEIYLPQVIPHVERDSHPCALIE